MTEEMKKELEEEKQRVQNNSSLIKRQESVPSSQTVESAINKKVQELFEQSVIENEDSVKDLTDNAVKTEVEIKNNELKGRKKVKEAETSKEIAEAKSKADESKSERSKTILKAQGFVSKLPTPYRWTALVIGYPVFIAYVISLGAVVQFLTFAIKGFITMVADCADRFADVNKKFVENDNVKQFNLGKAMVNILKWLLIVGAITTVVVLLLVK